MFLPARFCKWLAVGALFVAALRPCPARAERYALLVGINQYQNYASFNLDGCENDIKLIGDLLVSRFNFPRGNIREVKSLQATADGIRSAFRQHLIEGTKPGDVLVFYYSGHGSQIADDGEDEEDQMDEVLCPSDILRSESGAIENVIRDDEFAEWIGQLEGREFVAILDCCHSGTGVRDIMFGGATARFLPLNGVEAGGAKSLPAAPPAMSSSFRDGAKSLGGDTHSTLIAACRADEKAREDDFLVNGQRRSQGALTVRLLKGLGEGIVGSQGRVTYRDLKNYCERPLHTESDVQHPQVECDPKTLGRDLFSALEPTSPPAEVAPAQATPAQTSTPKFQDTPQIAAFPAASSPAAEPGAGVRPLKICVGAYQEFVQGVPGAATAERRSLESALNAASYLEIAEGPAECDLAVFYDSGSGARGANYVVGVLTRSGSTRSRLSVPDLSAGSLRPLSDELRRSYLVQNLERIENPDSPYRVELQLLNGGRRLALGQTAAFRVRSSKSGYLTVINIDSQGGLHQLFPNEHVRGAQIAAGAQKTVPVPSSMFELEVVEPVGREFVKAFVSERPLSIPVIAKTRGVDGFKSLSGAEDAVAFIGDLRRAIRVPKNRSQSPGSAESAPSLASIESLHENQWGAASIWFDTSAD